MHNTMRDEFLNRVGVKNSRNAIQNSLRASLQRNKTYQDGVSAKQRAEFRWDWNCLITRAADRYKQGGVCDCEHCDIIEGIASTLSQNHPQILIEEKLRFGTSQKAFNLYLKFLWCLGCIPEPPHCPVDGVILKIGGISGSWTRCDSKKQYMEWIQELRTKAYPAKLSEWEYELWNKNTQ